MDDQRVFGIGPVEVLVLTVCLLGVVSAVVGSAAAIALLAAGWRQQRRRTAAAPST